MSLLKRRWFAFILLALVVLLTFTFSGARALRALRDEALRIYAMGADGSGLSIANDLKVRADTAAELANIAQRSGVDKALIDTVREKSRAILETASVKEASRLNLELESAVAALDAALKGVTLSESDRSARINNFEEFNSRGRVILKDSAYNSRAEEFNKTLAAFPANLVARIAGVSPLELF